MVRDWQPVHPRDAVHLLSSVRLPWWFAGGWALDLFLGSQGRNHADLDVGVLRKDARATMAALPNWEFFESKNGALTPCFAGAAPSAGVNSLWGRLRGTLAWRLELLLDDGTDDTWVYRRDPGVTMPLERAIRRDTLGLPFLAPEIQLLYKARSTRLKDQADFARVAPALDADARAWLRAALLRSEAAHAWIHALNALSLR